MASYKFKLIYMVPDYSSVTDLLLAKLIMENFKFCWYRSKYRHTYDSAIIKRQKKWKTPLDELLVT